ncbi:MAG: hypothetical protein AAF630_17535 [Cyanobacteria bacterium P01_C01_bin.38]
MLKSVWAVVRKVLITLISDEDEQEFWITASETALNKVWDNQEDNVYAELLEK